MGAVVQRSTYLAELFGGYLFLKRSLLQLNTDLLKQLFARDLGVLAQYLYGAATGPLQPQHTGYRGALTGPIGTQ